MSKGANEPTAEARKRDLQVFEGVATEGISINSRSTSSPPSLHLLVPHLASPARQHPNLTVPGAAIERKREGVVNHLQ